MEALYLTILIMGVPLSMLLLHVGIGLLIKPEKAPHWSWLPFRGRWLGYFLGGACVMTALLVTPPGLILGLLVLRFLR